MPEFGFDQFLESISSYIVERVDESDLPDNLSFGYSGVMPPLSNRTDFKEFPNSYYPFLGVSPQVIQYFDGTVGKYYPKHAIQISYGNRSPGVDPGDDTKTMLKFMGQLEKIIKQATEETLFGLPSIIRSANLIDCIMYPSFYAKVEGDRKYYQIGVYSVRLDLGGI